MTKPSLEGFSLGECVSCRDGKCTTGPECVATSNPVNDLTPCPKCGEKSLRLVEDRGSDDYGDLEGAREFCEKCGYDTGWCVGRC